jgi:hypothetical protein
VSTMSRGVREEQEKSKIKRKRKIDDARWSLGLSSRTDVRDPSLG